MPCSRFWGYFLFGFLIDCLGFSFFLFLFVETVLKDTGFSAMEIDMYPCLAFAFLTFSCLSFSYN